MKRRTMIKYALSLSIAVMLAGCGNKPVNEPENIISVEQEIPESVSSVEETTISEEETTISEEDTTISEEVIEPEESDTIEEEQHFEKAIVTSEDDVIEGPGYIAKGFYSEYLGDTGISHGWYYYYTDSLETGKVGEKINAHQGNYVCATFFYVTNTTDDEIILSDHLNAKYVTKNGEYDVMILYQNPDQLDNNGYAINATQTVPLMPGEERHIQFTSDMPISEFESIDGMVVIYYDGIEIMNIILNDLMCEVY